MKKMSVLWCMLVTLLFTLLTARVTEAASLTCGTWSVVTSPSPGSTGNVLQGVAAVSASDIWAVGFYSNLGAPGQTILLANPLAYFSDAGRSN